MPIVKLYNFAKFLRCDWYRWLVVIVTCMIWLIVALSLWGLPDPWPSRAPSSALIQAATVCAAVVASLYAFCIFRFGTNHFIWLPETLLRWLGTTHFSLPLAVVFIVFGAFMLASTRWVAINVAGILPMLLGAALLLSWQDHHHASPRQAALLTATAAIVLGLSLKLWYVFASYIWNDEGLYISAVYNLLNTGQVSAYMYHLPSDVMIRPGWGYAIGIMGLWTRIFGVGLLQLRVFSYVIGLVALLLVYYTAKQWYGRTAALLTCGLVANSYLFILSTIGRSDAIPMLIVALTLWLNTIAWQQGEHSILHGIVGLVVGLSLEAHLSHLILIITFSGYYTIVTARRWMQIRNWVVAIPLLYYGIGLTLGILVYVICNILLLPHPEQFFETLTLVRPIRLSLNDRVNGYVDHFKAYYLRFPFEGLLIGASITVALRRRNLVDQGWLCLFMLTELAYLVVSPSSELHYILYSMPIYLMGSGALFFPVIQDDSTKFHKWSWASWVYGLLVILLAIGQIGRTQDEAQTTFAPKSALRNNTNYIREQFSTDTAIIAPSVMNGYLPEYRYFVLADTNDLLIGPVLTKTDPERYWMDVLLRLWPQVRIKRNTAFFQPAIFDSYVTARQGKQVTFDMWVMPNDDWVLLGDGIPAISNPPEVQLVGYRKVDLRGRINDTLEIDTLWVTREVLAEGNVLIVSLNNEQNSILSTMELSESWLPNQFHSVSLSLRIPSDIPTRDYTMWVRIGDPAELSGSLRCTNVDCQQLGRIKILP